MPFPPQWRRLEERGDGAEDWDGVKDMPRKTITSSNIGKEDRRHRSRDSAKVMKTPSVIIRNACNLSCHSKINLPQLS